MSEKQYVVFKLNDVSFGIDIENVTEIGQYQESNIVPNSPNFIEGVINYRGKVIPVVNLKKRFRIKGDEITKNTRIILIRLNEKEIGFMVDRVYETLRLKKDEIASTPEIINNSSRKYIPGIGIINKDRLLVLIDLKKVLSEKEIREIKKMDLED